MTMTQPTRVNCEKCMVRIPKNRPKLKCSLCNTIKHYRCQHLSKKDAISIINDQNYSQHWTCHECIYNILPINAVIISRKCVDDQIRPMPTVICCSCNKRARANSMIICPWCNQMSHRKCSNNILGCDRCCEDIIPGFHSYSYELIGDIENNTIYNPYSRHDIMNQIGDPMSIDDESTRSQSEISQLLTKCKYRPKKC